MHNIQLQRLRNICYPIIMCKLKKDFNHYLTKIKNEENGLYCFTISNTAKKTDRYYFTPVRKIDGIIIGGVVVSNAKEAIEFSLLADGKFEYIAVDEEKKIAPENYSFPGDTGNIKGEIQDHIKESKIVNYKANDITVNALDVFIGSLPFNVRNKKVVSIVGMGNVGFKLALKLVERGFWIRAFRRDQEKLKKMVECINLTKPKGTLANIIATSSKEECLNDTSVIVGLADNSNVILQSDLSGNSNDVILIDAGKACFEESICKNRTVYRPDIGVSLAYQIKMIIFSNEFQHKRMGAVIHDGSRYVCGVSGVKGDVVLHDINDFKSVIGVCDGNGGLIKISNEA